MFAESNHPKRLLPADPSHATRLHHLHRATLRMRFDKEQQNPEKTNDHKRLLPADPSHATRLSKPQQSPRPSLKTRSRLYHHRMAIRTRDNHRANKVMGDKLSKPQMQRSYPTAAMQTGSRLRMPFLTRENQHATLHGVEKDHRSLKV